MHAYSFIVSAVEGNLLHFNCAWFGTLETYVQVLLVVKV